MGVSICMHNLFSLYVDLCLNKNRRERKKNKTGLQPVSRPVELVHYFGGWVEGLWFINLEGG